MAALKPEMIGSIALKKAKELEQLGWTEETADSCNKLLRSALKEYLTAFWVFNEKRREISRNMHIIGKFLHDTFGCPLYFDGNNYCETCPVRLSHIDLGLSIYGTETHVCSICGKDPIDCEHSVSEMYNNVICQNIEGYCNICLEKFGTCGHISGKAYDKVEATRIVTNIDPISVDFVKNPNNPLARITIVSISKKEIENMLASLSEEEASKFQYGKTPIYCHHCLYCTDYEDYECDHHS